jgi:Bardet-Biedl syndrome 5 protein
VGVALLKPGPGERIVREAHQIEDSKGNAGDLGVFQFTNLRCLWYSIPDPKINLSIGYECILTVDPK